MKNTLMKLTLLICSLSLSAMMEELQEEAVATPVALLENIEALDKTRLKVQHHIFKQKLRQLDLSTVFTQPKEVPSCFICYAWHDGEDPLKHFCVELSRLLRIAGVDSVTAIEHNTHESILSFAERQFRKVDTHPNHKILLVGSLDLHEKFQIPGSIVHGELRAIDKILKNTSKVVLLLQDGKEGTSFLLRFNGIPHVDFRHSVTQEPSAQGTFSYVQKFVQLMSRFYTEEHCVAQLKALEGTMKNIIETFDWSEENRRLLQQVKEKERKVEEELRDAAQREAHEIMQSLLSSEEDSSNPFF